ncbi:MAG TPA: hypothetical protein VFI82_03120 [Terriglobales bacterium]|jgi:hypothetical protein|nr:hypothetical protein [Terriglobales bacterium]
MRLVRGGGYVWYSTLLLVFWAGAAFAQGGPPMRTDDPGTPGNGNWEINTGLTTDRRVQERNFDAPVLDINYGAGDHLQLNFEIPYLVRGTNNGPTQAGLGNSGIAAKWRFYENEKLGLDISMYPRLEFNNPTASVRRGLADRGQRFLMPFELSKKLGPIQVNPEAGYWFTQHGPDLWIAGIAVGHQASERLELLAEQYNTGDVGGSYHESTFGGGGRLRLHGPVLLIFMAGRSFRGAASGEPQLIGYLGLQIQIKKKPAPDLQPKHK